MKERLDGYLVLAREKWAELRPYYPHLAAAGLALFLGLIVGAFKISGVPTAVDIADRWPLPQWTPFRAGPQRDALAGMALWTVDPARTVVEEKKVATPSWRFIGTIQEGESRVAVFEVDDGKRVQRLSRGESLPNGAQIVDIAANELRYNDGDTENVLRLFSAEALEDPESGNGKN